MGEYENWDACIQDQTSKGQSKESAERICGEIKSRTEGKALTKDCPCKLRILKADGRFIIYGPASVEVVDRQRDKIRADGLDLALPQLLQAGRFSRNHEDVLVGAILPEYQADDGTVYKTGVTNNKLMVVGEVWDNTKAARDTRQGILDKTLRSFSISGEVLPGGSQKVCDSAGCYRDISKLDLHAVTICEKGMNQEAHFDVIQKGVWEGGEYITIATPEKSIDVHASPTGAEVTKTMTEPVTPPVEAKKEAAPGAAPPAGAGNGGLEAKVDKLIEMMGQMMGGMGKAQETQKAAEPPAASAAAPAEKPLTKADVELLVKQMLAEKVNADPAATTPRPAIKKQDELNGGIRAELMKDPSRLDKMSWEDIVEMGA